MFRGILNLCVVYKNAMEMNFKEQPDNVGNKHNIDEALLLKYINGSASSDEKKEVENWAGKSEENNETLTQLAYIYFAQKAHERINKRDARQAFRKVEKRIKRKSVVLYVRRTAVAASFIIGVIGIASLFFPKSLITPAMITVHSNDNTHTEITLPDGTSVHLNAASSLTYPAFYTENERKVALRGEAYFKVSHQENQPFIVSVPDKRMNIKVLGTEFNINAYTQDQTVQTTLVTGSIEVKTNDMKSPVLLKPSEKAIYTPRDGKFTVEVVNPDRETDWMYNRLVFRETPMKEVLNRLTRFYNVEFDVKNQIIYNYTFTGTFEDKPLYQVLDYMKISSDIKYLITYRKDDNGTKSVVELRK